jgi:uncharacterized protein with GYD domain
MPLYMTQFSYTAEAWSALAKSPQDRGQAFAALTQKLGGRFHNIYYCFGDYDGLVMFEADDDRSAAATIVAAIAPGHLKATKTTPLFTMEEALDIMRRAGEASYAGPSTP